MSFVYDPFDEASATNLALHPPTIGGSWTQRTWGGNNNNWVVGAGTGAATSTAGDALFTNSAVPPTADYEIEFPFTRSGFGGVHPHAVLHWIDNNNFYAIGLNEYGSYLQLLRRVAGTTTTEQTWNWSPPNGTYTVKARIVGDTLTALVDGVQRINWADPSPITPKGLVGLFGQGTVHSFDAVNLGVARSVSLMLMHAMNPMV